MVKVYEWYEAKAYENIEDYAKRMYNKVHELGGNSTLKTEFNGVVLYTTISNNPEEIIKQYHEKLRRHRLNRDLEKKREFVMFVVEKLNLNEEAKKVVERAYEKFMINERMR